MQITDYYSGSDGPFYTIIDTILDYVYAWAPPVTIYPHSVAVSFPLRWSSREDIQLIGDIIELLLFQAGPQVPAIYI